jgi:hypothetical protein
LSNRDIQGCIVSTGPKQLQGIGICAAHFQPEYPKKAPESPVKMIRELFLVLLKNNPIDETSIKITKIAITVENPFPVRRERSIAEIKFLKERILERAANRKMQTTIKHINNVALCCFWLFSGSILDYEVFGRICQAKSQRSLGSLFFGGHCPVATVCGVVV